MAITAAAAVGGPLSRRATGAAVTALLASASVLAATCYAPTAFAMSASGAASAAAAATVPSAMASHDFLSTALRPISLAVDPVSSLPAASAGDRTTAQDVLASQIAAAGGAGAVAFVVRRPG